MPFFQGARDFDINGGTFYDVAGNQSNHKHDNSFQISGNNNTTDFSPNLSRNDNRVYNMGQTHTNVVGYSSGMYSYGGLPQGNYQEYQSFLAWQQQGSPAAPNHFQPQQAVGGPHPHPQITGRQVPNGFGRGNTTRASTQSYPTLNNNQWYSSPNSPQFSNSQAQPSYPAPSSPYPTASPPHPSASPSYPPVSSPYPPVSSPYPPVSSPYPPVSSPPPSVSSLPPSVSSPSPYPPSSYNQPPNRPAPSSHWGSMHDSIPASPVHQDHRRAYSQPILNGAEFLSEESDVLSDGPDGRRFPGEGAISNLEAQFRRQAKISDPVDQAESRPHPTPAANLQPSTQAASTASSAWSSASSRQGVSPPPSTQSTSGAQVPPIPPTPNIATKPQQPQPAPSIPQVNINQSTSYYPNSPHPPSASQSSYNSRPQPAAAHGRPASSSSSDDYSSDSENAKNKNAGSRPIPNAVPSTPHTGALPTSAFTPPGPASNVAAAPGFRFDNQSPLSPQATNAAGVSAPDPFVGLTPLSFPSASVPTGFTSDTGHVTSPPAGVYADLKPLHDDTNLSTEPAKKKKKKFLERMGLKKSKAGKTL